MLFRWLCPWSVLLGLCLVSPAVSALSDEERSGARAAANQGVEAFDQQRWAEAIELFSRAEEVVHSPVHLSFIARAEMKLGHLVRASELFNRIKREPLPANPPKAQADAVANASLQLEELQDQLAYVEIEVSGANSRDLTVTTDGVVVASALVAVRRPIDPGPHVFKASGVAGGSEAVTAVFAPGERRLIELVIKPELASAAVPVLAGASATAAAGSPLDAAPASSSANGLRIGGYTALGVGVVGAALGTVFILGAKSKGDEADDAYAACGGASCPTADRAHVQALEDDQARNKTFAAVSFGVGGAALATGITLLILGSKQGNAASAGITPMLGFGSIGLKGAF
jgi:hypothetical protein